MHFMGSEGIELYDCLMQIKIVTWMSSGLLPVFTCVFQSNQVACKMITKLYREVDFGVHSCLSAKDN